jgi:hypothetical protein
MAVEIQSKDEILRPESRFMTDTQRNGTITAIGILMGFSLSFTYQVTSLPGNWTYYAFILMILPVVGVLIQLQALWRILQIPVVAAAEHKSISGWFVVGFALVLAGFLCKIVIDFGNDRHLWAVP